MDYVNSFNPRSACEVGPLGVDTDADERLIGFPGASPRAHELDAINPNGVELPGAVVGVNPTVIRLGPQLAL